MHDFQMLIQKIEHPGHIFRCFEADIGMFGAFKQFERDLIFAPGLFQLGGHFDRMLDRHDRVLGAVLEQEGRPVGADIGLRVGGFDLLGDFGDDLGRGAKIRGSWLRYGGSRAGAAGRSLPGIHPS